MLNGPTMIIWKSPRQHVLDSEKGASFVLSPPPPPPHHPHPQSFSGEVIKATYTLLACLSSPMDPPAQTQRHNAIPLSPYMQHLKVATICQTREKYIVPDPHYTPLAE